jgi:hypothetical protein
MHGLTSQETWSTAYERLLERLSTFGDADERPLYEPSPQAVNWERLQALRGAGAHESEDLYSWYAQKEE